MCNAAPRFSAYIRQMHRRSPVSSIGRRLRTKGCLQDRSQIVRPREPGAMKTVGLVRDPRREKKRERERKRDTHLLATRGPLLQAFRGWDARRDRTLRVTADSFLGDRVPPKRMQATQFLRNSESEEDL